jgi:hypothetical protein
MADTEMTSFRLAPDLAEALRKRAAERGETLSETMRQAALALLGTCPTCGQPVPRQDEREAAHEQP